MAGAMIPIVYCTKPETGNLEDLAARKIKGRVAVNNKGLKDVIVSDGYSVVATNPKGRYSFTLHPDAVTVFIATPAGYAFPAEKNITRHYHLLNSNNNTLNFTLEALTVDDNEHAFIIWADPQVKNAADVSKMMNETVPDVQQWVAQAEKKELLHGITVGDIVWDELQLFDDYSQAVNNMGIPFFQCLGNHDMDYNKGDDENSDDTFQKTFGPTHYSFNRGQVHYVIMDNVRYLGKDKEYDGFFQQNQLDWLQKDLSFVAKDKLIVLCVHIPVHKGTKNNTALYSLLEGRNVHIMSGHTHYHVNAIQGTIYEHNHGTVCGAWWTGTICCDGTPNGYGVYKAKGNTLEWYYKATGKPADHQMKLYIQHTEPERKILANIWNYDPAWTIEYSVDGIYKGLLGQIEGFDPLAYETLLGPDLPKPRGFAEPRKTNHLFQATIPPTARSITVIATDRFGKQYSETITA